MKNLLARFALALALGGLFPSAQAVILPVAEDTSSTVAGKIDPATGKAVTLSVTSRQQAFLIFDLSTLPATVTASNLTSARLNLYVSSLVTPGDLTVHTVTNAWQELSATTTAPGYSSEAVGTIPAADLVAKKFVEVDVTAAVSNWLSGASNCGFAIVTAAANVRLASKEGTGTGFPVLLEVESSGGGIFFNAGNVGIGTTEPTTELQVNGTVTATSFSGGFSGNGASLTNLNGVQVTGLPNLEQIALLKWGVSSNTFTVGAGPQGICFDGSSIWTANAGGIGSTVTKLNAVTGAAIGTNTVGNQPVAICYDGASIWTANAFDSTVTKLNESTGATTPYAVGTEPVAICFDGSNIWTANFGANSVSKLNVITLAAHVDYTVGISQPRGICFDGTSIWVANNNGGTGTTATKLNAVSGAPIGTFTVGSGPLGICFDGANIWVANNGSGGGHTVTKLNATTGATIGTYTVGTGPQGICFDGASIWVANANSASVTKLNASTGATIGTYTVGTNPYAICFDGASIWVAINGFSTGNTVTKL